jgi:prevent-host-death family protein
MLWRRVRSSGHLWAKMTIMTNIAVAEAKARFSELLDRVGRGEQFLVVRRGRPTAALVRPEDVRSAGGPTGLAALAGIMADWEEFPRAMEEIYADRQRARDRDVPPLDLD